MNQELLESAEFYNRRYHNFSSRVIIPTTLLFVFVLLFSIFAKKEITISSRATVEPYRIILNIQSTSNNSIVTNKLSENKSVKKGELLIQYQDGAESVQQSNYASQLDMLRDQKQQLEYLQKSLESGNDQFPTKDNFGYQQTFYDYLNQAQSLRSNTNQQNATIASQNAASSNSQAELGNIISDIQSKIEDYQIAKSAIQNDTTLDSSNIGYSIYQNYKNQSSSDNSNVLKSQSIAQIDSQISQMENNLSNYRVQYAGSGAQQAYSSSLDSQLESLRSQQLSRVGQELGNINQKIIEAETGKNVQTNIVQKSKIFAPEDGIVHLNPETSNSVIVPEGNLIAQLYPLLTTEKKVKITAYISSKDIAQIKVGDRIRFTTIDNLSKQQNLTSTISSIDTSATKTEKGSFFKVEAETKLTDQEAKKIRYGLEGRIVMITGKKSYFQYYLDQFLKKN